MSRWSALVGAVLACIVLVVGCSKGAGSPVAPVDPAMNKAATGAPLQTHLWGYYDVLIDAESGTVEAVDNRQATFTANVVQFLNGSPANSLTPTTDAAGRSK